MTIAQLKKFLRDEIASLEAEQAFQIEKIGTKKGGEAVGLLTYIVSRKNTLKEILNLIK